MAKKMTSLDLSKIETTDAAFTQMMANLPNIDIDPYASESDRPEEAEEVPSSSGEGDVRETSGRGTKPSHRSSRKQSPKPTSGRALMTISEHGRDSLNMAKQFYCRAEGVKMSREDFLLLIIDKSLKKLSPKAYERWRYFEDSCGED